MAVRREIVTLEDQERERFKAAVDGRAMENVLRRLRLLLKDGLDEVKVLTQEGSEVTQADIRSARDALKARLELLRKIPAVDEEILTAAATPLEAGIEECNRIETEEFTSKGAGPAAANGHGLSVVRPSTQPAFQDGTSG